MTGTLKMPDRKKDKKNPPSGEGKKQNPAVKVSPEFHKKLKAIAAVAGVEMGELVEAQLADFIAREWRRLKEME